jgi:hypothetical protein
MRPPGDWLRYGCAREATPQKPINSAWNFVPVRNNGSDRDNNPLLGAGPASQFRATVDEDPRPAQSLVKCTSLVIRVTLDKTSERGRRSHTNL